MNVRGSIPRHRAGIYQIYCTVTGKRYVGSSNDIWKRYREHVTDLQANRHGNPHLQRAFNKYGGEAFFFQAMEICERVDNSEEMIKLLSDREDWYISALDCRTPNGFNIRVVADSNLGVKHSEEMRRKCREAARKISSDPEVRKERSDRTKKYLSDPETREKGLETLRRARLTAARHEAIVGKKVSIISILNLNKIRKRGVRHHGAVLNDDKVRQIRQWAAEGKSQNWIAKEIGIDQGSISRIIRRKLWSHVV